MFSKLQNSLTTAINKEVAENNRKMRAVREAFLFQLRLSALQDMPYRAAIGEINKIVDTIDTTDFTKIDVDSIEEESLSAAQKALLAMGVSVIPKPKKKFYLFGATLKEATVFMNNYTKYRIKTDLKNAVINKQNLTEMSNIVRKIFKITTRNTNNTIRSIYATASNNGLNRAYNTDEIKLKWVAHNDIKTCRMCKQLDGQQWTTSLRKLNDDKFPGYPPLHFNCRCYLEPVKES